MSIGRTELVDGHNRLYPGALPATLTHGVLLTQLEPDGQRIGTVALDTGEFSELHGLRWVGSRLALLGRVRTARRDDGWDAFVALVPAAADRPSHYAVLDTDRGDALFDALQRADGQLVLGGSTGYTQNPNRPQHFRASVAAAAGDGGRRQQPAPPAAAAGPRHNQVRAVGQWAGSTWVGGMEDGPGTHSDDADPSRLRSNGYVRAAALADSMALVVLALAGAGAVTRRRQADHCAGRTAEHAKEGFCATTPTVGQPSHLHHS